MHIQIIDQRITPEHLKPATIGAAGIDLYACIPAPIVIYTGSMLSISTGIKTEIPNGHVGLIFPRSGIGSKGLILTNSTGVIDSDYRGIIMVNLVYRPPASTLGTTFFKIRPLDRIAQMVVVPCLTRPVVDYDEVKPTQRGIGGFGSTGQ